MASIDISNYKPTKKVTPPKTRSGLMDVLSRDISFGDGQLPDKKKEAFYHELGTLIRSGIDIKTSLELTASSYTQAKDVGLFNAIQQQVVAGKSLS